MENGYKICDWQRKLKPDDALASRVNNCVSRKLVTITVVKNDGVSTSKIKFFRCSDTGVIKGGECPIAKAFYENEAIKRAEAKKRF